jgi:pimeloyl-ACP methyl ester carboxylesterase
MQSIDALAEDCISLWLHVLETLCKPGSDGYSRKRRLILVGHSMGGALASRIALDERVAPHIAALVVVDVAEGTALATLDGLASMLETWPAVFDCETDAIDWAGSLSMASR